MLKPAKGSLYVYKLTAGRGSCLSTEVKLFILIAIIAISETAVGNVTLNINQSVSDSGNEPRLLDIVHAPD